MKDIGEPVARVDGHLKVTGAALYCAEIPQYSMVYAVLVTSTIANGAITSLDEQPALDAEGVVAVFSHKNTPHLHTPKLLPAGQSVPILQGRAVYYGGQPVAVVLADTFEHAEHAATLVKVGYSTETPASNLKQHLGAAYVPAKMQIQGSPTSVRGDPDAGLRQAEVKLKQVYTTPVEHHNPMEPHATIAVWEGEQLTVYETTQAVGNAALALSHILGIPADNVRVVSHFLGGGFGCKGMSWPHAAIAAMAAREIKRPVKLVLTRPQMFFSNGHRPTTRQEIALGADQSGKLTAIRHAIVNHTSMLDDFVEMSGSQTEYLYSCPNVAVKHSLVKLNTGTPTFTRAPGFTSGSFGLESAMDELAIASGIDPLALRLRNYAERDEHNEVPWSSKSLRECYARAAERFGWQRRPTTPRTLRDGQWLIGYGMATATYPAHFQASSARAGISADGSVLVQCGTQDIGTGTYTVMSQVVATTLGVPLDWVRFELGDTRLPKAPGSGGSTTAASVGSAVMTVAQRLRDRLIDISISDPHSPFHGLPASSMVIREGYLMQDGSSERRESLKDLVARQPSRAVTVEAKSGPGAEQGQPAAQDKPPKSPHSYKAFGTHFCEVRVDADLGEVRISRMVSAFAAGRILNQRTAISQLRGGMIFGIGMALMEESRIDRQRGFFSNANLADYLLPVNADVPFIEALLVEETDPHVNPAGVKGLGEIGVVGVTAAIANAVFNATGTRIRDLPITAKKLIQV